jgi:hypothetical protein
MISLVTLAPGVTGAGVTSNGSPGSGVLNLTPNPDSIQEATVQTNTYNVDYGRASSIQMTMTTKSRTSSYHGEQVRPEGTPILKNKVEKSGKFSTTK